MFNIFEMFSLSLAPKKWAETIPHPIESPMKKLIIVLHNDEVAPTAARALLPAKLPTTIISATLKRFWRKPLKITGIAKAIICFSSGPLRISIFCILITPDNYTTCK